MGLWQNYKNLGKRTRIVLGLAGIIIGFSGPTIMSWIVEGADNTDKIESDKGTATNGDQN